MVDYSCLRCEPPVHGFTLPERIEHERNWHSKAASALPCATVTGSTTTSSSMPNAVGLQVTVPPLSTGDTGRKRGRSEDVSDDAQQYQPGGGAPDGPAFLKARRTDDAVLYELRQAASGSAVVPTVVGGLSVLPPPRPLAQTVVPPFAPSSPPTLLYCSICIGQMEPGGLPAKGFTTQMALSQHQRDRHGNPAAPAGTGQQPCPVAVALTSPLRCDLCVTDKTFATTAALEQHRRDKHAKQPVSNETSKKPLSSDSSGIFCRQCDPPKRLTDAATLKNHVNFKHVSSHTFSLEDGRQVTLVKSTQTKLFSCPFCIDFKNSTWAPVKTHVSKCSKLPAAAAPPIRLGAGPSAWSATPSAPSDFAWAPAPIPTLATHSAVSQEYGDYHPATFAALSLYSPTVYDYNQQYAAAVPYMAQGAYAADQLMPSYFSSASPPLTSSYPSHAPLPFQPAKVQAALESLQSILPPPPPSPPPYPPPPSAGGSDVREHNVEREVDLVLREVELLIAQDAGVRVGELRLVF